MASPFATYLVVEVMASSFATYLVVEVMASPFATYLVLEVMASPSAACPVVVREHRHAACKKICSDNSSLTAVAFQWSSVDCDDDDDEYGTIPVFGDIISFLTPVFFLLPLNFIGSPLFLISYPL